MNIKRIEALEVFDSSGNPTVEINVIIANHYNEYKDYVVKMIVPSKLFEMDGFVEQRDINKKRLGGKGVASAVTSLNTFVTKALATKSFKDIRDVDSYLLELDGTKDRSNLGTNEILGLSLAFLKAFAISEKKKTFEYVSSYLGVKAAYPKPVLQLSKTHDLQASLNRCFSENVQELLEVVYEIAEKKEKSVQDIINKLGYEDSIQLVPTAKRRGVSKTISEIGTVSEIFDEAKHGTLTALSTTREGTEETILAHIAYGLGLEYIYLHSIKGSCVFATVNEMLRIEKYVKEGVDILD